MITIGNDLTIYNAWGEPKMRLDVPNDFKQSNELMSEHYVQFSFNLSIRYYFVRGDYMDYNGKRYVMRTDCQPIENGLQNYRYELKFEAPEMFWQDFICWYIYQGLKEAEWTLMEKAENFLQIACDNINAYTGETWTVGVVEPTDMQNMTFSSQNVFDMLTDVAEAFNCEWYVDYAAKTINLVYSYSKGEPIELRREIELIDIYRSNENSDEYCTRMYAFGGTRNIPTNYRGTGNNEAVDAIVQKRLRLPVSNGDFIDAFPDMTGNRIIEKVFTFDNIYPRRTGTITSLRTATVKNEDGIEMTVFYFKDSGLNFSSAFILPGLTLSLQFGENSFLSGRDFELGYNDSTEEFEIINNQDNPDLIIPNDILCPRIGDFYVLYNFDISQSYFEYKETETYIVQSVADLPAIATIGNSALYINDTKTAVMYTTYNGANWTTASEISTEPEWYWKEESTGKKYRFISGQGWSQISDASIVSQYIEETEQELLTEAQAKMDSLQEENATYTCMVNPVRVAGYGLDMELGQSVKLKSLIFDGGEKVSRVRGYTKYPVTCKDEYLVGEKPRYSRRKALEAKVDSNKTEADVNYLEAMKLANRNTRSVKGLNYLRTALQNETTIDKGLLLTTLIRLGAVMGGEWIEKAGINGAAVDPDDVVAYFGGSLDDAITGLASIVFKMDGSGHLSKGNISWDALGNLLMRGLFESNVNGDRIVIDPETRILQLISTNNSIVGSWAFGESGSAISIGANNNRVIIDSGGLRSSQIGNIFEISTQRLGCIEYDDNNNPEFGFDVFIDILGNFTQINMYNIPSNPSGLPSGTIYRDGNNLKIV